MPPPGHFSDITVSTLLTGNNENSLIAEFGHSLLYGAVQAPLEGVAQLWDGKAGGRAQQAVQFMNAPQPSEFCSARWAAQQAGSAIGSILPVLLIHKGVCSFGNGLRAQTLANAAESIGSGRLQQLTTRQLAESAATGLICAGVLSPTPQMRQTSGPLARDPPLSAV